MLRRALHLAQNRRHQQSSAQLVASVVAHLAPGLAYLALAPRLLLEVTRHENRVVQNTRVD